MNSQDFLILNVVGAGAFVFWYLAARAGAKKPTRLNLYAKDSEPVVTSQQTTRESSSGDSASIRMAHPDWGMQKAKDLNIMFNYNGHSWDAYEVLGVPAGASLRIVTEAYHQEIRRCEKDSIEFLETAYKAILARR